VEWRQRAFDLAVLTHALSQATADVGVIGRVTDIKVVGLMAQVTISIGSQRITSIIAADAISGNAPQK
jgi:hypothetical protein